MRDPHIGRRFGARPGKKAGRRWLRIPLRGLLLCFMVSPVAVIGYQALVWLNTGRWAWVPTGDLLSVGDVSAMAPSWSSLYGLALPLAGLPLAGVLSLLAIAVYVIADALIR